jgi:hypothetical protein
MASQLQLFSSPSSSSSSSPSKIKKRPLGLGLKLEFKLPESPPFIKDIIHDLKHMTKIQLDEIYDKINKREDNYEVIDIEYRIRNTKDRIIIEILEYTTHDNKINKLKNPLLYYKSTGTSRKTGLTNIWLPASIIFNEYYKKELKSKTYIIPKIIGELSKLEGLYLNLLEHISNNYIDELDLKIDDKINMAFLNKLNDIYKRNNLSFNIEYFKNNLEIDNVSFQDLFNYKRLINYNIAAISKYINSEEFNTSINKNIEKFKEHKYNNANHSNNSNNRKKTMRNTRLFTPMTHSVYNAREINKQNNKSLFTKKFFNNNSFRKSSVKSASRKHSSNNKN